MQLGKSLEEHPLKPLHLSIHFSVNGVVSMLLIVGKLRRSRSGRCCSWAPQTLATTIAHQRSSPVSLTPAEQQSPFVAAMAACCRFLWGSTDKSSDNKGPPSQSSSAQVLLVFKNKPQQPHRPPTHSLNPLTTKCRQGLRRLTTRMFRMMGRRT